MSSSNHEGRNQKLVIDYLEALLSDSEDSTIEVSKELLRQSEKEQLAEQPVTPTHEPVGSDVADKIQVEAETDRQVSTDLEVEISADPAASAGAIEIDVPEESAIAAEQVTSPDSDLHAQAKAKAKSKAGDLNSLKALDSEDMVDTSTPAPDTRVSDAALPINTLEKPVEDTVNGLQISVDTPAPKTTLTSENEANIAIDQSNVSSADTEVSAPEQLSPVVENIQSEAPMINAHSDDERAADHPEISINCLIVLMYGLKLAIPFEHIEGHIRISNVTLSIDNDRDWIIGDFTSLTMRTHIVDTAQIIFGNNYDPLRSNYNEMLVLQGKHWSIMFDKVIKTQNIKLRDVSENPSPQLRPWLTGTYMAEKCALVNVAAMVKMFEEQLNG